MRTVTPKIGQAFAEWMLDQDNSKAHAADTPFRFSGVMGCARQLGYKAAELDETDPMDGSSLAITKMGSLLHEDIQTAVHARWPKMTFEGKGILPRPALGPLRHRRPRRQRVDRDQDRRRV